MKLSYLGLGSQRGRGTPAIGLPAREQPASE